MAPNFSLFDSWWVLLWEAETRAQNMCQLPGSCSNCQSRGGEEGQGHKPSCQNCILFWGWMETCGTSERRGLRRLTENVLVSVRAFDKDEGTLQLPLARLWLLFTLSSHRQQAETALQQSEGGSPHGALCYHVFCCEHVYSASSGLGASVNSAPLWLTPLILPGPAVLDWEYLSRQRKSSREMSRKSKY